MSLYNKLKDLSKNIVNTDKHNFKQQIENGQNESFPDVNFNINNTLTTYGRLTQKNFTADAHNILVKINKLYKSLNSEFFAVYNLDDSEIKVVNSAVPDYQQI